MMKKLFLSLILILITLFTCSFSLGKAFSNGTNDVRIIKTLVKIRNPDTYEPVPKNLQYKYIKDIPKEHLDAYKTDMDKALQHILYDKITYNNKTLNQMLLDLDKESDKIYQQYLNTGKDKKQNKTYIEQLKTMNGTISLYPNVIIEEIQPFIMKYNLNLEPGSEADIFLYKYYVKKYQLKYSNKLKELLELKEYVYKKIDLYILKLSDKI